MRRRLALVAMCMAVLGLAASQGQPGGPVTIRVDTAVGSFLFAVGFMLANWVFAWACYRRGLIIKV
jgi:hypothetical protein